MNYPLSFILGPFFILVFFFAVVIVVSGIKYIFNFLFPKKQVEEVKKSQRKIVRKPKSIRSIEIDPSEVDKIYVKKSS